MASGCTICGELPAHVDADLEEGESLPAAASKLDAIADGNARRCPECGAFFLYIYDYEYGAMGDGWETARLERIDKDRVVALLLDSAPSTEVVAALAQLDVPDAGVAIEKRLLAALDVPETSYNALLKLINVFWERDDWAAIERLLQHPRPEVRSDALYALHNPGSGSWFRAARAATDPNPGVHQRAVAAAIASAHQSIDPVRRGVIASLDDSVDKVRSNAAWTLAVWAEGKSDISDALPALRRLFTSDPSHEVRTTAKRALVGAGESFPAPAKPAPVAAPVAPPAIAVPVAVVEEPGRVRLVSKQLIGAHVHFPREPAWSPDGSRFVTGDQEGWIVMRARRADDPTQFEETQRFRTPGNQFARHDVHSIVWPIEELVVASEYTAVRARRASKLEEEVAVAKNRGDVLASGGGGTWLGVLSGSVWVFEMPTLKSRSLTAVCRGNFDSFSVGPLAVDPRGTLFAVADDGGSSETAMGQPTDSGEPQITIVDGKKKRTVTVAEIEKGSLTSTLVFDPWRTRIVTAMYGGDVGFWSYDGTLQHRFQPYGKTHVTFLVATERWLLMMPNASMGNFRLDFWDPVSFERVSSIALPKATRPQWVSVSPDANTLLTFEDIPRAFAIRIWAIEG